MKEKVIYLINWLITEGTKVGEEAILTKTIYVRKLFRSPGIVLPAGAPTSPACQSCNHFLLLPSSPLPSSPTPRPLPSVVVVVVFTPPPLRLRFAIWHSLCLFFSLLPSPDLPCFPYDAVASSACALSAHWVGFFFLAFFGQCCFPSHCHCRRCSCHGCGISSP